MRRIVILLGPPGAGKGTVARSLVELFGFRWLSSGALLRNHKDSGTLLGRQISSYIDRGALVPDELITALIVTEIAELPADCCLLLDGFPRTLPQARSLDEILTNQQGDVSVVVELQVDGPEIRRRIVKRGDEEGRCDDTMTALQHRLHQFRERTLPLTTFYARQQKLRVVAGTGTPEEVADRIRRCIRQALQIEPVDRQKEAG